MSFYSQLITVPHVLIKKKQLKREEDISRECRAIQKKVQKLFGGSLAIMHLDSGSSNAEEQELLALVNPYYDIERFGIHFVPSPRHADMLIVTGAVSRNMRHALLAAYEAMPDPKIVVAFGDAAIDGGIYKGSYAVCDGVNNVIPVNFEIPGNPPTPRQTISAILHMLGRIEERSGNA